MNKILFSAVIAALFCNVANAQTMKVGEFLKGQKTTRTDLKKARKWQYRPDGQDFVCVNGENRYTRALYGSHDEDRIETSDRPVFVAYKKNDSRNISFRITVDGKTVSLEKTDYCEARYTAGRRSYTLRDKSWGDGTVKISVLAFPDRRGGIWKFEATGFKSQVRVTCRQCDIANQNLKRWGDMGCEEPGSLEAGSGMKNLQEKSWYTENAVSYLTFDNMSLHVATPRQSGIDATTASAAPKDRIKAFAEEYDRAERYRQKLAGSVVFCTPDPYINTLGGVLTTAGDGSWDGDTFLHGAITWRMQLPGWRGAYMGDFLGWNDRAVKHFDGYAESQVKDVPCTISHPTQDSTINLCRAAHVWGSPMYSNGYICRVPHRNNVMHHYDMNLNYIDELLWHFSFDADREYLCKMWPVVKSHLAWEKLNYDPNDDGLYDAYCCIWASDGLYYNSGGVAHSSAYNYRGNVMAARIAEILGEDPAPYRKEADKILKAMNSQLWMDDKGCWAEYKDLMGLQRLHKSPALWTVYTPIDSYACTPEQAYSATRYVDENIPHIPIKIEGEESDFYTLSTTNWMPYVWSTNNVAQAEVMHTALAYFHAGRSDEAFRLMKGDLLDEMYLGASPGNIGQISYYDAARGETYRDFADNVGVTAKTAIQGLYGISPDALWDRCYIRPGFPAAWDSASIKTPYIEYSFKREGDKEIYDITQNFKQPLQIIIRQNIGNGRFKETALTNEKHQRVVLQRANVSDDVDDRIAAENRDDKYVGTEFDNVNAAQCSMVKMDKFFNSCVTDIFKNEYTSPSSPYTTLRIPKNGYGEWCHPQFYAETNDSVFRTLVNKNVYTARLDAGTSIPFRSKSEGKNIAYTSLWDNYPDSISIPLKGRASHAYLMLAGTTNQMQSRIANGVVCVTYVDGSHETLELVNPDNWCPIEQDYYVDDFAFKVNGKRPYRVHLMSDKVSRDLCKELGITGVYGREINGGAAELLDMRLNPGKKLKSITVRTLSNDVVIGLMGITLQK